MNPTDDRMRAIFETVSREEHDDSGIGLRAAIKPATQGTRTFRYEVHVDAGDLWLLRHQDRAEAQLAVGFAAMRDGQVDAMASAFVHVSLTEEQRTATGKDGISFVRQETVPAATEKVRIVVMDMNSGEVGSLTLALP